MATIVADRMTGKQYVLLGAGLAAWASSKSSALWGDLSPREKSGTNQTLCICDARGRVGWLQADHATVLSVDGQSPQDLLSQPEV